MTQRVLRTRVRVTGDDGQFVVLRAGTVVPEEYEAYITNPRCYVDTTSLDLEREAERAPAAAAAAAEAKAEAEREALEQIEPEVLEQAPEPESEEPVVQEPDAEPAYEEQTVAELHELLEARELPVSGTKRELIARLKADDAK